MVSKEHKHRDFAGGIALPFLLCFCSFLPGVFSQEKNIFILRSVEDAARFDSRYLYIQKLKAGDDRPVAAIRTAESEQRFVPYHPDSIDCLRCVYWGKFYLKNELKEPALLKNWILEFNDASYTDVFVFDQNGRQLSHGRTGTLVPAAEKDVEAGFRINRVKLTLTDTAVAAVYIRYERTTGHRPGFDKFRLIPKDYYEMPGHAAKRLRDGLFMGFLLTTLLFNLLFFIATLDRAFLYQSFFIFLLHQTKDKTAYFLTGAMVLVILGVVANGISVFQGRSIQVDFSKWVLAGNITLFFSGTSLPHEKVGKRGAGSPAFKRGERSENPPFYQYYT